jgi:hypothetical protein
VVAPSTSKQIRGYYIDLDTNASFQILGNSIIVPFDAT